MAGEKYPWRPSLADAARLWRAAPVSASTRHATSGLIARGIDLILATTKIPARSKRSFIAPGPLVVSGFHSDVLGLGTAARLTTGGLRRLGFSPIEHDLAFLRTTPIYENVGLPGGRGGVWISHMNPPELLRLLFMLRRSNSLDRYNVGYWAWELDTLPPGWAKAAEALHEIWTPSRFVQSTVQAALPDRCNDVKVVPHPIELADIAAPPGDLFPWDGVSFLTMADFRSTNVRKNPTGAIQAFIKAFPTPVTGVRLICKFVATDASTEAYRALRGSVSGRTDIMVIDEKMSDGEVLGLIERCDVLLSLHRSEGYGLTLAEAMRCGRCVIATGWSGNMDFMDNDSAILVPYKLVPAGNEGPYGEWGGRWAEPDVDFAAKAILELVGSPEMRARLGAAAATRLINHKAQFSEFIHAATWRNFVSADGIRGRAT